MHTASQNVIFGAAKELITPRERTTLIGFGPVFGVPFESIHDDLYVRTLVLEDAWGERVVLMGFDLLFHDDSLTAALRDYAGEKYGVKPGNLHVAYSHTHFAPAVRGYDQHYHTDSYEAFLLERCCACIDRAFRDTCVGTMDFAAVEGDWNISRRVPQGNGKTKFAPNPDGDRDPNLYLLRLRDEAGQVRVLLTSFACHPSNLAQLRAISAEYPGRLCALLEERYPGCTALFFQGFGADTKLKRGAQEDKFTPLTYEQLEEVVQSMVGAATQQLERGSWTAVPVRLAGCAFTVELPLEENGRAFYESELAKYSQRLGCPGERFVKTENEGESGANSFRLMWSCADYVVEHYEQLPDAITLNCGVVRLNQDFYIFSMGGEPVVSLQNALRDAFPSKRILCFGYNDAIAYIPSDKVIEEGGYEAGEGADLEYRLKGRCKLGVTGICVAGFGEAVAELDK